MDMEGLGGLIAFLAGWLCAQTGKVLGDMIRTGRPLKFKEVVDCFMRSGGMPSSHTASFVGLTTYFIVQNGFFANISVLSMCMAAIVIFDAVNVRYAVGEQGKLLNVIVNDHNYKKKHVRVVEGHTVPQAIIGGIIGIIIGLITGFAF